MKKMKLLLAVAALGGAGLLQAQTIEVKDGWVRTTVQGQSGTGAYMKITAPGGARLIGASTPVAGVTEIHEMKMDGNVMRMRALPGGLELPPGKTVELGSGGYHLMLTQLKAALPKGSTVPLTLVFKNAKGTEEKVQLTLPVALAAPGAVKMAPMDMQGDRKH